MNGQALQRLRRARERLDEARVVHDGALVTRAIEDVLVDLRAAFNLSRRAVVAGQSKKAKGRCRKWFEGVESEGRSDPLIAWAWSARDQTQHEASMEFGHSYYVDYLATDDLVRPPGFESADLIINADGPWLVRDAGTARERRVRPGVSGLSAHAANVHQIGLPKAPTEHLGRRIASETDLFGVVEMALEWTASQLQTADDLWGRSSS